MPRHALLASLLLVPLALAQEADDPEKPIIILEEEVELTTGKATVPFRELVRSESSGRQAAARLVIRSAEQLAESRLELPAGVTVDWERESVLGALMGVQPPKSSITIASVSSSAAGAFTRWTVTLKEVVGPPRAGDPATPIHLVKVPRVAPGDPVDWVVLGNEVPADLFEGKRVVDAYGVGGGAPGAYGQRWGKGSLAREGGGPRTESAVAAALDWLRFHQSPDGRWEAAGWLKHCGRGKGLAKCAAQVLPERDLGDARYDVGTTALALLAFVGNGHTHRFGAHKRTVSRGLDWLKKQQQPDGSLGWDASHGESIYNHALATLVLCELYAVSRDFTLKRYAEKAVELCLNAQNPGLGWKYGIKSGRNDTSVTSAMALALEAARTAGITVPPAAFEGAGRWFDRVTDARGEVGYETPGGGSAFLGPNDGKYELVPCMSAASLASRLLARSARGSAPIEKTIALLGVNPPTWEAGNVRTCNFYYWYFGTYAMFQVGGPPWKAWNERLLEALLPNQRQQGCDVGSWDPACEWALAGGRVYATAINALTLEVYYRHERRKD